MFPDLFRDDVFTLETARLFLRWPKAKDVATLCVEAGDRRVAESHAVIPHPYRPEDAVAFVSEARSQNLEGRGLYLAITARKDQERLLGVASLRQRPTGEVSLGYWLGVSHWGKGYATEAAQALLDAAFLYTNAPAIIAGVRVTNDRSRAVLERCGFQYVGSGMSQRPAWGDTVHTDEYRLSRRLWASLKGWRAPLPTERPEFRESA
ncbi:MAG: GNAT family N-acetyltransferase [Methylobacterium sp.]|nr:MAG: GNAT family N-acetyltransferase [Methylobacterium sp.]